MWKTSTEAATAEPRAWLPDGEALSVVAADQDGISVELRPEVELQSGEQVEVSLGDATRLVGPLPAVVRSLDQLPGAGPIAVLHFGSIGAERRRQLAALLLRWPASTRLRAGDVTALVTRSITDPHRIDALLSMMEGEHAGGLIRVGESYSGARVSRLSIDESETLPLRWELEGNVGPPPYFIEVGVYEFLYVIPVVRAQLEEGRLAIAKPDEILRLPISARWLRAVAATSPCAVRIAGVGDCPLRRASRTKLAFAWPQPSPIALGTPVSVMLETDLPRPIHGSIVPETLWPSPDSSETLCTARFTPASAPDWDEWRNAYERLHHPHTRRAGTWAASLWALYDKSGYFQLSGKTSVHFSHLRHAFTLATRRLDTAPEIGCHVTWPSHERIQAALSALVIYSGTAMIYQVARRRDEEGGASAREMLRQVNLHAFEQLQRDPGFEWTLVYVQEGGARWSHLAYQTFTESMLSTGLTCVVRFRAMESTRAFPTDHSGFRAGEATAEEQAYFFSALSRLRPPPYLEALDLVPERFDLQSIRDRWARAGFARERALLVARDGAQAVAAAVLESAQDALHLFGLLDCVRLFPLTPGGEAAYPVLLGAARSWYRARNKSSFVCFYEAESFDAAQQSGLHDLGAANLMAFPRLLMPDFLEHLWLVTSPRRRRH